MLESLISFKCDLDAGRMPECSPKEKEKFQNFSKEYLTKKGLPVKVVNDDLFKHVDGCRQAYIASELTPLTQGNLSLLGDSFNPEVGITRVHLERCITSRNVITGSHQRSVPIEDDCGEIGIVLDLGGGRCSLHAGTINQSFETNDKGEIKRNFQVEFNEFLEMVSLLEESYTLLMENCKDELDDAKEGDHVAVVSSVVGIF